MTWVEIPSTKAHLIATFETKVPPSTLKELPQKYKYHGFTFYSLPE